MERVFVGMSGGVDSSVAAMRLIKQGYDVVGVFIKVWHPDFLHCNWEKERLDAMRVAAYLNIPFLTMDAESAYKQEVADYMIRSYEKGITPNPDVMCNEHVKFGVFYSWARALGASYIATGHYARVSHADDCSKLHVGIDPLKDQSYFLYRIKQEALNHTLFPVGDTTKKTLRREAEKAGIPTAAKPDSQGICFLGEIDMYEFLSHYISLTPGRVLNMNGEVIGSHKGAILYTLGQRHGFTVHGSHKEQPHYVVARNRDTNTITVSSERTHIPKRKTIVLSQINEIGSGISTHGLIDAVTRYHGKSIPVTFTRVSDDHGTLTVESEEAHEWAEGQSCVLYKGTECIGGGIIS